MSASVTDTQPIEVLPATVSKNPVSIIPPGEQGANYIDILSTTGHLTTVVSPSQAFQVINQDYLAPVISKPNAIVRPLLRNDQMNDSKVIAYVESQIVKNDPGDDFVKELDKKLRRLKKETKSKSSSKNGSNQETLSKRPLFITTVPKGIFLQPPTEIRVPSRLLYAYSSKPRIFTNRQGPNRDKCHLTRSTEKDIFNAIATQRALNNNNNMPPKERETQPSEPYKNVMHDKRVVRGSNYSQLQTIAQFITLALALVGAASAGYISPVATGYTGLGWGNGVVAAPAGSTYSAPAVVAAPAYTPLVKNVFAAPAVSAYSAQFAPSVVAAPAVTPFVKNFVGAPAVATYGTAAPVVSAYSAPAYTAPAFTGHAFAAPAISTYAAAPVVPSYGVAAPAIYGQGFANNAWGVDLWKKKKAAAH